MEKDTEENYDQEQDKDFIEDDDSYVIDKAFKTNIKDDPASIRSRPRNIPVYKLQISDEDAIPKMPERILIKPDEKAYDEKNKALKEAIDKKYKSIDELKTKKREALHGPENPEMAGVFEEHKKIKDEVAAYKAECDEADKKIQPIKDQIEKMNNDLKKFDKYHFTSNVEAAASEIKQMQESLSFSQLSITEEKKITERKAVLEEYIVILRKIKELKDKNKEGLDQSYKRRNVLKEQFKKMDPLKKKISAYYEKRDKMKDKKNDNPVANQLSIQIDSLKADIDGFYKERDDLYNKFNDDYYEYEKQQKLIDYIKRANDKIHGMKKRIEKEKKRREKEEKKGFKAEGTVDPNDLLETATTEHVIMKYDEDLKSCDFLSSYFSSTTPQSQQALIQSKISQNENTKLDEDIQKGFLKEIKDDEENILAMTKVGPKKKKGKAPSSGPKTECFSLDFNVIAKIKELGLVPPKDKNALPEFFKLLEEKKAFFIKENVAMLVPEKKKEDGSAQKGESA